jgi:hypothetical protein
MDFSLIQKRIFSITSQAEFNELALEVFHHQYTHNSLYRKFVQGMGIDVETIKIPPQIPFLPVSFFKSHKVYCADKQEEIIFESSTTSGNIPSRHFVADLDLYEESFRQAFRQFYGAVEDYIIIGLLPSYLERQGSSLVYMVNDLIVQSGHPASGFYLYDHAALSLKLEDEARKGTKKLMLIGVGFALMDFIENHPMHLPEAIIVETGGMKGRREELIREELHERLCKGFAVNRIYSEYGMTELLSQAWSNGYGFFRCPTWMNVMIRDANDPLCFADFGRTGGINVIDLANLYSCSFIATDDLGRMHTDGTFEVLGRFDASDVRGCSLMVP